MKITGFLREFLFLRSIHLDISHTGKQHKKKNMSSSSNLTMKINSWSKNIFHVTILLASLVMAFFIVNQVLRAASFGGNLSSSLNSRRSELEQQALSESSARKSRLKNKNNKIYKTRDKWNYNKIKYKLEKDYNPFISNTSIFVGIFSEVGNFELREAARGTWLENGLFDYKFVLCGGEESDVIFWGVV